MGTEVPKGAQVATEKYVSHNDTVAPDGTVTPKSPEEISERVYRLFVDSGMEEPGEHKTTGYRTWSGFTASDKKEGGAVPPVSTDNPTTKLEESQVEAEVSEAATPVEG